MDDEVTIMLYKDGSVTCTGYKKYSEPSRETANLLKRKGKQLKRQLKCEGLDCKRVTQQKDRLLAEEAERTHSG